MSLEEKHPGSLNKTQLAALTAVVGQTHENEINCDECLADIGEFVELRLAGKDSPGKLDKVVHHLSICPECQDEYAVLKSALQEIGGDL